MGLGAAASEPGTLSMLRHLYPDARARSRAVGIWAGTSGFALAAGPVIGGVIVGAWNWRGIFWFNLVFGLAALIVAAIILPESSNAQAARVDIPGTLLAAGALGAGVFAIIDAESAGFGAAVVIALLCVSAALLAAFGWWEHRAPYPLLDLRFLRVPEFTTGIIAAFCTYFATFAIFFFTALYLVEVVGASGYRLAAVFAPMTILMIVSSVLAGRWTAVAGPRWSISLGCLLFAAGLFLANGYLSPRPDYGPLVVAPWRWPGSASAPPWYPSPPRCCRRCRPNDRVWPRPRPTPAAKSVPSPAWRSSARSSTHSSGPAWPGR